MSSETWITFDVTRRFRESYRVQTPDLARAIIEAETRIAAGKAPDGCRELEIVSAMLVDDPEPLKIYKAG